MTEQTKEQIERIWGKENVSYNHLNDDKDFRIIYKDGCIDFFDKNKSVDIKPDLNMELFSKIRSTLEILGWIEE